MRACQTRKYTNMSGILVSSPSILALYKMFSLIFVLAEDWKKVHKYEHRNRKTPV
jgi:hypothetical protein